MTIVHLCRLTCAARSSCWLTLMSARHATHDTYRASSVAGVESSFERQSTGAPCLKMVV